MSNDLIELIYKQDDQICTTVLKKWEVDKAESMLRSMPAHVRLDCHGVLDTLPTRLKINRTKKYCMISYTGRTSRTRETARSEAKLRIKTGLIDYGILMFARGRGKNKYSFTEVGSKAWVNSLIPDGELFIDDGEDHIQSVKLACPNLRVVKHNPRQVNKLIDLISE